MLVGAVANAASGVSAPEVGMMASLAPEVCAFQRNVASPAAAEFTPAAKRANLAAIPPGPIHIRGPAGAAASAGGAEEGRTTPVEAELSRRTAATPPTLTPPNALD